MLKAVTRQAAKVDNKIRQLNAEAAAAADALANEEGTNKPKPKPAQVISTANFFDHHATPEDIAVMVTEVDFLEAHRELIPSVSAGELAHYERVRATFEGGRGGGSEGADKAGRPRLAPLGLVEEGGTPRRTASSATVVPRSAKGKGKAVAMSSGSSNKGKGKAVATGSDDDDDGDDDDDDGYENDYGVEAEADDDDGDVVGGGANGTRDKGKGKAVAEFRDGTASDDDGLYDE